MFRDEASANDVVGKKSSCNAASRGPGRKTPTGTLKNLKIILSLSANVSSLFLPLPPPLGAQ